MYAAHNMQHQMVRVDFSCKATRVLMVSVTDLFCCSLGLGGGVNLKFFLPKNFPSAVFLEGMLRFSSCHF